MGWAWLALGLGVAVAMGPSSASADLCTENIYPAIASCLTMTLPDIPEFPPLVAGPAVPETSTWVMMLVGFAGVGSAGLRKARMKANLLN